MAKNKNNILPQVDYVFVFLDIISNSLTETQQQNILVAIQSWCNYFNIEISYDYFWTPADILSSSCPQIRANQMPQISFQTCPDYSHHVLTQLTKVRPSLYFPSLPLYYGFMTIYNCPERSVKSLEVVAPCTCTAFVMRWICRRVLLHSKECYAGFI